MIGKGWGLGIGIGLFLYHYLLWALYETERLTVAPAGFSGGIARWSWLLSPVLVLAVLGADVTGWMIEQTLLETGAFTGAVACLALRKCAGEGRGAPWFLAILVFVAPAAALLATLGSVWAGRRPGGPSWLDAGFAIALVLSLFLQYRRLFPFVMGGDRLVEPLSDGRRTVFAVVWLAALLVGGIVAG